MMKLIPQHLGLQTGEMGTETEKRRGDLDEAKDPNQQSAEADMRGRELTVPYSGMKFS